MWKVTILVIQCALLACCKGAPKPGTTPRPSDAAAGDASPPSDGAVSPTDAQGPDAPLGGTPGVVTCYTEGNPSQSCTLPTHCCFSNFSSQHDGACSTGTCAWGTITCDGPEDCNSGERCCSHALFDSGGSLTGYTMTCQATACGAAPANYELCHPNGAPCAGGGTCVTAYLNDNDLPRTLDICR